MGGYAAAFTNPPDVLPCFGGSSVHATFEEAHPDALRNSAASIGSAFMHSGHGCDVALNVVHDSGAQPQQPTTAAATIFDRSALLCNSLRTRPLEDHGARTLRAGKTASHRRSASAPTFENLSAQALACENQHGNVCHNMPAGPRALPLHAAHHTTSSEAAPSTRHAPGWVLEAPQGEQPGHVSDVLPATDVTDGANVVQHDSGHPSHYRSSMRNFVAHSSLTGDLSSSQHAPTTFSTSSGMVPGWVPGAPPKREQPEHHPSHADAHRPLKLCRTLPTVSWTMSTTPITQPFAEDTADLDLASSRCVGSSVKPDFDEQGAS